MLISYLLVFSNLAYAGCENDMDCKGERVCNAGLCTDPSSSTSIKPKHVGITEAQQFELDRARSKAKIGYNGAISTGAFGIGSLLLYDDEIASLMLGSGALLTAGITIPMASAGGANARSLAKRVGVDIPSSSLAQQAWLGYSLAMLSGAILVGWGIADEPPPALILSTTILGSICAWSMAVDAETSVKMVEEQLKNKQAQIDYLPRKDVFTWSPAITIGEKSTSLGVLGTF